MNDDYNNFKQWVQIVNLTEEEYSKYLGWCVKEIDERVKEIVSNQYRGAYNKAALLILIRTKKYSAE